MKKVIILFLFCYCIVACEKDDICDGSTPTTSQLVIKFYNASNVIKKVTNLRVIAIGVGPKDTLVFNPSAKGLARFLLNDTILKLPLRTTAAETKYKLILNYPDLVQQRTDEIQFNYSQKNEFVSRACGFKTLFDLSGTANQPFILNNNVPSGNWIQNIQLIQPLVNNEKITNIKIIF